MRRIPRTRWHVVAKSLAIDVANHGGALCAARPVAAGAVLASREGPALRRRAGEHVVTVRREADAGDDLAALGERRIESELVVVAVRVLDARRDDFAFEVLPRSLADAVARIHGRLAIGLLRAEVGVPGLAACAMALRQHLAVLVRALQAPEVG